MNTTATTEFIFPENPRATGLNDLLTAKQGGMIRTKAQEIHPNFDYEQLVCRIYRDPMLQVANLSRQAAAYIIHQLDQHLESKKSVTIDPQRVIAEKRTLLNHIAAEIEETVTKIQTERDLNNNAEALLALRRHRNTLDIEIKEARRQLEAAIEEHGLRGEEKF